ncbi:ABC transporter permease [Saccharomonospora xinjiangensis]|uniref:ABC transporter permease n=1 Tax=Saccharomonospora xinjiangensis TaxID=75294 RepID=UPI00106FE18A|nr:ABC transporter permease [Saccharomonospora xinjiangensis]QBQ60337.1 ABC-2 family transporter protein [Saccharomonospora xinjiangensis]
MNRVFTNTVAAELSKLRGLPAVMTAMHGTVAASIVLSAAVAAATDEANVVQVVVQIVPFVQIGFLIVGVLAVATEYEGRQIRTALTATPNRPLFLAAKTIAFVTAAATTSAASVGAALATASVTLRGGSLSFVDSRPLAGAAVYLVLIGLLGFAVTVLFRSLIPPLVTMLAVVLIASPLLASVTEHARWLPDRAGRLLYLSNADPILTPGTGALVLVAWIAVIAVVATWTFWSRDA